MGGSSSFARGIGILLSLSIAVILSGFDSLSAGAESTKAAARASAASASATEPVSKTKHIDHTPTRYFVEFRARNAASYGHLYVMFGKVNARGEIVESKIAGLHPAGDATNCYNCSFIPWTVGHVIFVPSETGASDGDLEEKYVTARYRVWIDAAEYEAVTAYIRKLQSRSPLWNAVWRNCVAFGRDVATYMRLKIPLVVWLKPKDFVTALRTKNGMIREQLPLRDADNALKALPLTAHAVRYQALQNHWLRQNRESLEAA